MPSCFINLSRLQPAARPAVTPALIRSGEHWSVVNPRLGPGPQDPRGPDIAGNQGGLASGEGTSWLTPPAQMAQRNMRPGVPRGLLKPRAAAPRPPAWRVAGPYLTDCLCCGSAPKKLPGTWQGSAHGRSCPRWPLGSVRNAENRPRSQATAPVLHTAHVRWQNQRKSPSPRCGSTTFASALRCPAVGTGQSPGLQIGPRSHEAPEVEAPLTNTLSQPSHNRTAPTLCMWPPAVPTATCMGWDGELAQLTAAVLLSSAPLPACHLSQCSPHSRELRGRLCEIRMH